uniref:Uncharacterized protein n=1 Tax=uncultured alpha proteobacterium HF0130_06E21 TaxID=710808 RepID=E0XT22_9PROT|nr:hypothetical protein [uncultured alpha proteobacterium HF0130_06E21]
MQAGGRRFDPVQLHHFCVVRRGLRARVDQSGTAEIRYSYAESAQRMALLDIVNRLQS